MTLGRAYFAIFISAISLFGLNACQTSAPAVPVQTPGSKTTTPAPPAEREKPKSVETKPEPAPPGSVAPELTRQIANNCFTCHGPAGKSPGTIPGLAHLSAAELAKMMKNFRTGATPSTVMGRHAKAYTDSEIDAVANYIAGLKR